MARKPRIHIDGGYYHVMLRGNGGDDIFSTDADRYHFCLLLQQGLKRFKHRVHAFCLMDNHVHLVIQVGSISLSRIIQNVSFRYTRWFNARINRSGHLFQGRFKALLIDEESYLLELVRYTHLNPVRARIVQEPSAYLWSSHLAYTGQQTLSWLTSDVVLSRFSPQLDLARKAYAVFIANGLTESHRSDFHIGASDTRVLGDDHFAEKALLNQFNTAKKLSLDQCIKHVCNAYEIEPTALPTPTRIRKYSEARAMVAWLMRRAGSESLTAIASHFNRDIATISTAVRKLEERLLEDHELKKRLDASLKNIKL